MTPAFTGAPAVPIAGFRAGADGYRNERMIGQDTFTKPKRYRAPDSGVFSIRNRPAIGSGRCRAPPDRPQGRGPPDRLGAGSSTEARPTGPARQPSQAVA